MTTTTVISGIFGGTDFGASPTDQGSLGVLAPDGGSPTDQGGVVPLFPSGGSPTDQGNPPPAPITREISIANAITFAQTLAVALELNVGVSNVVTFGDGVEEATKYGDTQNTIIFGQIIDIIRVVNIAVSNSITFDQKTQRTYDIAQSNSVTFAAASDRKITLENLITFSQQIIADASSKVENRVTFDSSVTTTKILNLQISNNINFNNFVVAANDAACDRSRFASNTIPEVLFVRRQTIILQCAADTIELRNPELGNSESVDVKTAQNETRYGRLSVFRNPIWPKKTTLEFDISVITKAKALELHDFLVNCLGREVTLTDHESRVWVGVIDNPEALINELSNDDCNYSTNLVLIGEPQ
jgi:hypothetical protein